MSVYPKKHNWDHTKPLEKSPIKVISRAVSPSRSLPARIPWGQDRPKPIQPSDSIMFPHEELRTYSGRYSKKLDNKLNQMIAAEHGFIQRHSRRAIDKINTTLTLASVIDPRANGVGSKGGHIARRCGSPGPLNNSYEPKIGVFSATEDPIYNVLYQNQKFQERSAVVNPEWERHFVAHGSLNLKPVYKHPSKVQKSEEFEKVMDQFRYSLIARGYEPSRIMSAEQIEEMYKHYNWKELVAEGKRSYELILNPNIKSPGRSPSSSRSSSPISRPRAVSAGAMRTKVGGSARKSSPMPRPMSVNDMHSPDDAMSAITTDFSLFGSTFGENSLPPSNSIADDEVSVSITDAPKTPERLVSDKEKMTPSSGISDVVETPLPSASSNASIEESVDYIPKGELSTLEYAIMEAEFGAMQDEIKLLGLNIEMSDIKELLSAVKSPAHTALPLASYIGALCGIPATFEATLEVLQNKANSVLCFIHEVEPLCLSLRRIRKAYEIKTRMMQTWKWKLPTECSSPSLVKIWSWVVCFDNIAELIIAIYRIRRETTSSSSILSQSNAADASPFFSENSIDHLGVGFPTILLYRQFCKDLCHVKECPSFWERVHKKVMEAQAEEESITNRRRTLMVEKSFREVDMGLGIMRRGSVGITSNESGKLSSTTTKSSRSTVVSPVNFDKYQGPKSRKNNSPKLVPLRFSGRSFLEDLHEDECVEHQPSEEEMMNAQTEGLGQRRKGTEVGSVIADNRVILQQVDNSMEQDTKVILTARRTTLNQVIVQATQETGPIPAPLPNYTLALSIMHEDAGDMVGRTTSFGRSTSRITTEPERSPVPGNVSRVSSNKLTIVQGK